MRGYLLRHLQVLIASLGRMARSPLPSTLTIGVLGIALALPAGLLVVMDNLERVSRSWEGQVQMSIYLAPGTGEVAARRLADELGRRPHVKDVSYLNSEQALAEFRELSGLGQALDVLDENPLPAVIVLGLDEALGEGESAAAAEALARRPEVDHVQLDLEWVRRLQGIVRLARRAALILAALLGIGVVLIVGSTTRAAVLHRRDEIEIIDRIGATPAFIRRPFLYTAAIQGALGGLVAWWLVAAGLALLKGPSGDLVALYGGSFSLRGLGMGAVVLLVVVGGLLAWAAARIAVGWQLRQLDAE